MPSTVLYSSPPASAVLASMPSDRPAAARSEQACGPRPSGWCAGTGLRTTSSCRATSRRTTGSPRRRSVRSGCVTMNWSAASASVRSMSSFGLACITRSAAAPAGGRDHQRRRRGWACTGRRPTPRSTSSPRVEARRENRPANHRSSTALSPRSASSRWRMPREPRRAGRIEARAADAVRVLEHEAVFGALHRRFAPCRRVRRGRRATCTALRRRAAHDPGRARGGTPRRRRAVRASSPARLRATTSPTAQRHFGQAVAQLERLEVHVALRGDRAVAPLVRGEADRSRRRS